MSKTNTSNHLTGLAALCLSAQSSLADFAYRFEKVVDGIDIPWGMVWLPNGDMLVTEKAGTLRVVRDGELLAEPVSGPAAEHRATVSPSCGWFVHRALVSMPHPVEHRPG